MLSESKGLMTYDLKMVQCSTESLYNNLKKELVWKQKHNTVTMMFSSYNYISTAIFLIKKKKEKKERKKKEKKSAMTIVVTV
jgi:hypothetical protein